MDATMTPAPDSQAPMAGADAQMPADPNAGMADPNMGTDPNAGADMGMGADVGMEDPNAADPSMAGDPTAEMPMEDGTENNGDTAEIDELWGKLDTEDRSALLKYGESMVDNESETPEDTSEDPTMSDPATEQPMMERIIFTKGQLKRLNENLKK